MPLGAAFGGPNALTKDSSGAVHIVMAINGGVYSARWDGSMWGPAERIEDREIDPHGQEIGICQGNKLQVVYDDRNDSQKIWYSNRTVDAPKINRSSMLVPSPTPDDTGNVELTIQPLPTSDGEIDQDFQQPLEITADTDQSPANPLSPMVIAAGIVIVLIMIVILFKRR
jgi:hypothetical protein